MWSGGAPSILYLRLLDIEQAGMLACLHVCSTQYYGAIMCAYNTDLYDTHTIVAPCCAVLRYTIPLDICGWVCNSVNRCVCVGMRRAACNATMTRPRDGGSGVAARGACGTSDDWTRCRPLDPPRTEHMSSSCFQLVQSAGRVQLRNSASAWVGRSRRRDKQGAISTHDKV